MRPVASMSPSASDFSHCRFRIVHGLYIHVEETEILHRVEKPGYMTDHFQTPRQPRRMTNGRCIGMFPDNTVGDQRLPLRIVLDQRLEMLVAKDRRQLPWQLSENQT